MKLRQQEVGGLQLSIPVPPEEQADGDEQHAATGAGQPEAARPAEEPRSRLGPAVGPLYCGGDGRHATPHDRTPTRFPASTLPGKWCSMSRFVAGAMVLALFGNGSALAAAHGRHSLANAEQVRQVQQKLNDIGYHAGSVDGVLGPHTESALRQFQRARNLDATGHIDSKTLAALERERTG